MAGWISILEKQFVIRYISPTHSVYTGDSTYSQPIELLDKCLPKFNKISNLRVTDLEANWSSP